MLGNIYMLNMNFKNIHSNVLQHSQIRSNFLKLSNNQNLLFKLNNQNNDKMKQDVPVKKKPNKSSIQIQNQIPIKTQ